MLESLDAELEPLEYERSIRYTDSKGNSSKREGYLLSYPAITILETNRRSSEKYIMGHRTTFAAIMMVIAWLLGCSGKR